MLLQVVYATELFILIITNANTFFLDMSEFFYAFTDNNANY